MKKVIFVFVMLISGIMLTGCFDGFSKICLDNISEYRRNLFTANNNSYFASFAAGQWEENFDYNGKCGKLKEYGILTVKFKELYVGTLPSFVMFIDSLEYSGHLEYDAVDEVYRADIKKEISSRADVYLEVRGGDINEKGNMICISNDWKIDYKSAFNIAINKLKKDISKYNKDGKLNGEFFIKIVGEKQEREDQVYWYVLFVTNDGKHFAVIVDVNSGEILAQK